MLPPPLPTKAKLAINLENPSSESTLFPKTKPVRTALPLVANSPPVKPTASPGLSAIEYAIYPASTGTIRFIDRPPIYLNNADSGVH